MRHLSHLPSLPLCFALCAAFPASAQSADDAVLQAVQVTAARADGFVPATVEAGSFRGADIMDVPATVNVVTRAVLDLQAAGGLYDALKNTAGVTRQQNGGDTWDQLVIRGIAVEPPTPQTLARIKAATDVDVVPARLIDLTLAGAQYKVMKGALDVLTTAPEFDLVVVVVGSSARFYPDLAVKPIVDCAGAGKPIAAFLVPEAPDALARLAAAGVPGFHTPEACADAVAAALQRRAPRPVEVRTGQPSSDGTMLDELQAYALLDRVGVARAASIAFDCNAKPPALPFAYPVVVKALSDKIAPKSDIGGVVLNVRDEAALTAAITKIQKSTAADRILVQPMVAGLAEVLIGYRIDSDVGPVVMLAAGGILAEIHRDRSLRLAPIDLMEARAMIGEVAALKALAGYRGRPAGDLDALAAALVALSRLAVVDGPAVAEAEVNPLIVKPAGEGVIAVDALVKLA
ncbi:MAG: acetate--CoA ligase family protein [Alphaproteobacteria bacterium]|nr:acetate--CoA ligase family protein [Alphaproteobacteria bacterium]